MQALSGRKMYGKTLPEHMQALGFLGPRVNFEHGIWLTPRDIEIVRDTGTTIVHNPISNMKLGSGICPVPRLLDHDVNVALGTDGMSSNDGNDMFAVLKVAGLLHKLWDIDYERWLGAREAWRMATAGGAERRATSAALGSDRGWPPRRPRAARPRQPRIHAALEAASPRGVRLDDDRRPLGHDRRALGRAGRAGDRGRRAGDPRRGARDGPERAGAATTRPWRSASSCWRPCARAGSRRSAPTSASTVRCRSSSRGWDFHPQDAF